MTTLRSLGQAGFIITHGEEVIVIDPYLSNAVAEMAGPAAGLFARRFPAPVSVEALVGSTLVLHTHEHADHCDRQTVQPLARLDKDIRFVGPQPVLQCLCSWGIEPDRLLRAREDTPIRLPHGTEVWVVPAAHYTLERDADGQPKAVGYVIKTSTVTVYHAGDTITHRDLIERLNVLKPDVGLLPVNGRDREREALGIVGNLTPSEAVELAEAINIKLLIPMHNDLFPGNSLDSTLVAQALSALPITCRVAMLPAGAEISLDRANLSESRVR